MFSPRTAVDWLRFRTQADPRTGMEAVGALYGDLGGLVHLGRYGRGMHGFRDSAGLFLGDLQLGRVDYGGDHQRGWSRWEITGRGCEFVSDWSAVEGIEALEAAEVRRVDLALTTWEGEVTHQRVVDGHTSGGFAAGGRPPSLQTIVSTDERAGRTCYVGRRAESDKFFRGYEKGYEMAARYPGIVTHIEGYPIADIYRCEVELKSVTRPIPWDVVANPDEYFSGAYPFCRELLPDAQPLALRSQRAREVKAEIEATMGHIRAQFGDALYTLLTVHHGDIGAVWDRIVGRKHSQRLIEAGVLLLDADEIGLS